MYPNTLLYIDGAWSPAASGRTLPVVNPATGEQIGTVAHAERADLDRALEAADKGFKVWRKISAFERSKIMRKAANLMRERADAIAPLLTQEQGKTLVEAKGEILAGSKFRNAGQVCVSPTRFLVQEGVYNNFVDKFVEAVKRLKVGNGLEAGVTMGALANPRRTRAMEVNLEDASKHGGKVKAGGHRIGDKGNFYEPTVVTEVSNDAKAMNEEPFGPLAMINPFRTFDDAVAEANRLPFGLAAYAWTNSAKTANAIASAVETGMITINHLGLALPEVPFGGVKDSGYGSEGGSEAIEAYLNSKFVSQAGL